MQHLHRPSRKAPAPRRIARIASLVCASVLPVALTGCGIGTAAPPAPATLHLNGLVRGGQQPVSNALVQLWAAGQTGNGNAPTALISSANQYYPGGAPNCTPSASQTCYTGVYTDGTGSFTLTGDYTCPSSTRQVYLTVTGGNPGIAPTTGNPNPNNPALLLFDALGSCGNLKPTTNIYIDEVTTAAAAWALSPFMDANGNVGSSATNSTGIANAFLNAQLLADPGTGAPATLDANRTVETGKLLALANALAGCVNSSGTTGCQPLISAATVGNNIPANTMAAALNIVRNPSNKVSDVFYSAAPQPPFVTSLTLPPHDWTMSLTVTGGGIHYPSALDVDSFGNVWVANYFGVLSGFSPQGVAFNPNGFSISGGDEVYGLTIDTSNNIWVTNEEQPYHGGIGSITALYGASSGASMGTYLNGNQFIYANDTDFPLAMSADSNGNVLAANYANSTATVFNNSGGLVLDAIGSGGNSAFPVSVTADPSHGVWLANQGDNTVSHFDVNGNLLARVACCDGANGIATDAFGNAWIANYYGRSVSEVSNANAVLLSGDTQGGVVYPSSLVIDAAQNVWVANFRGASFSEIAGNANALAAGTGISPSTGYGLDANLVDPFDITLDPSGDLWLSNFDANTLTMFFGLATPTATPILPVPTAP